VAFGRAPRASEGSRLKPPFALRIFALWTERGTVPHPKEPTFDMDSRTGMKQCIPALRRKDIDGSRSKDRGDKSHTVHSTGRNRNPAPPRSWTEGSPASRLPAGHFARGASIPVTERMNLLYINDRHGEYPNSWYAATAEPNRPFPELKGERRAEVCVVGGGFTGLSTALHLALAGLDVALVEAHRVGFGASGRNGGQVCSGYHRDQNYLEKRYGTEFARKLWNVGEDAKTLVRTLLSEHGIDATWRDGIARADWTERGARMSQAYVRKLRQEYGYEAVEPLSRDGIRSLVGSGSFRGGMIDWGAGHLHPLRFALGLSRAASTAGARIFERSEVLRLGNGTVMTANGLIRAEQTVLACNGYIGGLSRRVASRIMPVNNFIVATEPLGHRASEILTRDIAVSDSRFVVNYWRLSEDGRLLFGGGESYGFRFPSDIVKLVRKPMLGIYPQLRDVRIDYAWGGTLAITRSRMPDFVRLRPGLWSASGYSGHGVALATIAGRLMAEAISGDRDGFDIMAAVRPAPLPKPAAIRPPLMALAMAWHSLRDRLGV